jgi:hypothetical protein
MTRRPPSGRNTRPTLTIANTPQFVIRVWTRYVCDCGHVFEAMDVNMDNPEYVAEVVCPGCHRDVVSISRVER